LRSQATTEPNFLATFTASITTSAVLPQHLAPHGARDLDLVLTAAFPDLEAADMEHTAMRPLAAIDQFP